MKHIAGRLFDDDLKPVSFSKELELIQKVVKEKKLEMPQFELILGITEICGSCCELNSEVTIKQIKSSEIVSG